MKTQQISFVKTYTLQDFMALHFSPSSYHGRIMIGSRKAGNRSVYQVAAYPVDTMADYLGTMKQVNQDYYITANAFSGICREYASLFSLHNIVIDVDCHENISPAERSHILHRITERYKGYVQDIDGPNTIVKTGRGLQMWWAIQPVSAKCEDAYREVVDKLTAQTNRLLQSDPEICKYISRIDAAPTNNLAGYFRLPGSYNTRSRTHGSFEILHFDRLNVMANAKRKKKEKRKRQIKTTFSVSVMRLAKQRIRQMDALRELRRSRGESVYGEQRDLYLFILYNSLCKAYNEEKVLDQLRKFNASFANPLPEREITRNLSTAKKKSGYAISNRWIIEQLQITEEEQEIINLYPAGSRRGSAREQERESKRQAKYDRNKQIIELHQAGATYIEIASQIGCSKETVGRVVRASGEARTSRDRAEKIRSLYLDQAMDITEIASAVGCSLKTVKKYLNVHIQSHFQQSEKPSESRCKSLSEPQEGALVVVDMNKVSGRIKNDSCMENDVKNAFKYLFYWVLAGYTQWIWYPGRGLFCILLWFFRPGADLPEDDDTS